jgi:hypothetical protein
MAILDTAEFRDRVLDGLAQIDGRLVSAAGASGFGTTINNFRTRIVRFTPVVDTAAYGSGDVLFNTTAVAVGDAVATTRGTILSASVIDRDDEASQTITLYFLRTAVTFGALNSPPSITDDGASEIIGTATVTTGTDLGGCRYGESSGIVIPFELPANLLYVAATTGGTPTFTNSNDIRVRLSLQIEAPV